MRATRPTTNFIKKLVEGNLVTRPPKNLPIPGSSTYQHWGVRVTLMSNSCKCSECDRKHVTLFSCHSCEGSVRGEIPRDTEFCLINFVWDLEIGEGLMLCESYKTYDKLHQKTRRR